MNIKTKKKLSIAVIALLIIISFVVLWIGFKKESTPIDAPGSQISPTKKDDTRIFFASDGKNSVYKIKKGDKWSVIWNGEEGKEYDAVSNPTFSSDGTQIAYSAELDGQSYVVVNNNIEINAYEGSGYLVFSQDGTTIAFVSDKDSSSQVVISVDLETASTDSVINGEESDTYSQIGVFTDYTGDETAIILSPDGEQVAYTVVEDDKIYIIINDEQIGEGYDSITDLTVNDEGEYSYTATVGDTTITVVDNEVVSQTDETSNNTSSSSQDSTDDSTSSSSSDDSSASSTSNTDYKYKISTQKDPVLETTPEDYTKCSGVSCNF